VRRAGICAFTSSVIGRLPLQAPIVLELDTVDRLLEGAGVAFGEVDGWVTVPHGYLHPGAPIRGQRLAERLGARLALLLEIDIGGASSLYGVRIAQQAVEDGSADAVVVSGAQLERNQVGPEHLERLALLASMYGDFVAPYGVMQATPIYALSAQRYMHRHGLSEEDIAWVTIRLRDNASRNPRAELRDPVGMEEVLLSRMVSPPLRLLFCAPWSDGAAAVLVASEEWARRHNLQFVAITGFGAAHSAYNFIPFDGDIERFPWIGESTRRALSQVGRSLDAVDVAEVYGAFAPHELITYEEMGFFTPGEAARAVRSGITAPEGQVALNPSGGRIALGHPPPATPLLEIGEVFEQLTGTAAARQRPKAALGLVQAEHGMINGSLVMVLEAGA
jgi:acetyl-CoA acetyltransferase